MFVQTNKAIKIMPMVQAYAEEVLNQKDSESTASAVVYRSNSLFLATERLLGALDRLEQGLDRRLPDHGGDALAEQLQATWHENAALRQERESLNTAIDDLKSQYSDLHRAASGIYNKLEDSIRRLTQIMKE
jgi:hypothetical protein